MVKGNKKPFNEEHLSSERRARQAKRFRDLISFSSLGVGRMSAPNTYRGSGTTVFNRGTAVA